MDHLSKRVSLTVLPPEESNISNSFEFLDGIYRVSKLKLSVLMLIFFGCESKTIFFKFSCKITSTNGNLLC